MSDNKLTNINKMSNEQIMQAIGQDDGSNMGNNIPRLAINRTPEDDDGNQLPVGHFYTYDSNIGKSVFGKPVTLRPFISAMQYMHYDAEKGEYNFSNNPSYLDQQNEYCITFITSSNKKPILSLSLKTGIIIEINWFISDIFI